MLHVMFSRTVMLCYSMLISTIRLLSCKKLISRNPHCTISCFSSVASAAATKESSDSDSEHIPKIVSNSLTVPSQRLLELDTVGVVDILMDLRRQPDDALVFFRNAERHGFVYDVKCYAAIVRILCGSGLDRKLGSLFLEVIASKEKHPHFDVSALFKALVESFGDEWVTPLDRVVDVLVKSYVELEMFDDAIDTLFQMGRRGLSSTRSCNFMLNRLVECGKIDMAFALFHQLKNGIGLSLDVYMYTIVIKAHCRKGNLQEAIAVFDEMDEAGVTDAYARTTLVDGLCINGKTSYGYEVLKAWRGEKLSIDAFGYNAVIRGFCNEMRFEDAEIVLEDMRRHGVERGECSYSGIIRGYCQIGNILKAFSLHKEMVEDGVRSNCFIASAILQCLCNMGLTAEVVDYFEWFKESGMFLDEVSYTSVIDAFCKLGEMEEAEKLLDEMRGRGLVLDAIHYTCLINGYCCQEELGSALNILNDMKETGVKPDIITYNILIGELCKQGYAQEGLELLSHIQDQGLQPSKYTYSAIIKGLCTGGKVRVAREFFNALEEKSVDTCSAMLNGYIQSDHTIEAYGLFFKLLSTYGTMLSRSACLNLLDRLCKEWETERALKVFEKMLELGMELSEVAYSMIISGLCRIGDMDKAQAVFNMLTTSGVTPDVKTYTAMMNGYCKVKRLQKAYDIFDDMKEKGIKPDVITYTVLVHGAQREKLHLRKCHSRPRSEGIKDRSYDASALQSEMNIMDIKPDVVYYTVLIDGHCKANNLQEAVHLFDELMERGFVPDAITYTALVSGYCSKHDVVRAEYLVDEMASKGIVPDTRTISALENGYEILEARKVKLQPGKKT